MNFFSMKLKLLRMTRNMTQKELAKIIGVTPQAVSRWETGAISPRQIQLLKICDTFNCKLKDLFEE